MTMESEMHRILVCGGREFADKGRVFTVLDYYRETSGGFMVVIHGAARGADSLAGEWATTRGIPVEAYPANWERDGRRAGPIRNAQMLREGKPTVVIAFPGGRGTADMIAQAKRAGVPALEIPG
jgi:hypothetical protein